MTVGGCGFSTYCQKTRFFVKKMPCNPFPSRALIGTSQTQPGMRAGKRRPQALSAIFGGVVSSGGCGNREIPFEEVNDRQFIRA